MTIILIFFTIPLRFFKKYKNLWVISERPNEARDNGYWLFDWILKNKPEENVRFILSKNSKDYDKMPRKDLIIEPGSLKHYVYYILSSYSVSTHMHGASPGKSFCIPFLPLMRKKKTVFLQHGIIKDYIPLRGKLDIIIASSYEEKELILKANPKYEKNVFVTGLCRYDGLKKANGKEKIILVMPTFRKKIRDIGRLKNADEVFISTLYYKKWNSFLNNKEFNDLIYKNNIKVIFFPHNEIQKLAHNFLVDNKNITIGKPEEFDIQELLCMADILVTDYSSVLFDFVYMGKPVAYYQFDQEDFFSSHYKSSGKAYPFGEIAKDETDLVLNIKDIIKRGYTLDKKYIDESKNFYRYRDNHNCERNFNVIKGIYEK